jgi:hypothetical protein
MTVMLSSAPSRRHPALRGRSDQELRLLAQEGRSPSATAVAQKAAAVMQVAGWQPRDPGPWGPRGFHGEFDDLPEEEPFGQDVFDALFD